MIKKIRIFVLDKILSKYQKIKIHFDSTTGLKTSVYADEMKTSFSTDVSRDKLKYYLAVFIA